MPGLVGLVRGERSRDLKPIFNMLVAPMCRGGHLQLESCFSAQGRWAVGRVHRGILQPRPQLTNGGPVHVLFHGDLLNEKALRHETQEDVPLDREVGVAALIKQLYGVHGRGFASRLEGSFCAVVLDDISKTLMLASDCLGSYPLYWSFGTQRFVFASELKALLGDPAIGRAIDPRAVADYLTFGFVLGDKTLSPHVRLLPPACTLTYSWEGGSCIVEPYARLQELYQPWEGSHGAYQREVTLAFSGAIDRSLSGSHSFGLSLSGGLDSRAILSAVNATRKAVSTYTLGVRGCADEVVAKQISRIAGAENSFLELDTNYVADGLPNIRHMVSLTDGMYLTHGLTEMLVLAFLERAGFSVLLRGHGGELAKTSLAWPFHTDERVYRTQNTEEFVAYLLARANYISRGVRLDELFAEDWSEQLRGVARQSLADSVSDVHLSPPDLCSYLYLTEHHRRFTVASLEIFRNVTEVRMPFVDVGFLRVLLRGPAQWRDGTDIHKSIIRHTDARLLGVRDSNTGAPVDAGPLSKKLWDKVNAVMRRLNIYGYRHYHDFESWMKQRLLDSVEQVLLHPESLERGIYREVGLRRLIEETRRGIADHAYLLQILLILELWQQENG